MPPSEPMVQPASSSLKKLRGEITLDLLRHRIAEEMIKRGLDPKSVQDWKPVAVQVRISSADTRNRTASESPSRQISILARYCVNYEFRPDELCFEAQTASLTDKKPRRLFEDFRQRIESGDLEVEAIVTYNIDRFTRDRLIGERWLDTLKRRGVDLHEADEDEPPLPLAAVEAKYAAKFLVAWQESKRTSKRITDAQRENAANGRLLSSVDRFGHQPVWENDGTRRRQARGVIVEEEAAILREVTRRLHDGELLYAILVDLNERGSRGRQGGLWTHGNLRQLLTSPRMIGHQRLQGEMVPAPIEPILTRAEWEKNVELLKATPKARAPLYAVSGLGVCASCGSSITASGGRKQQMPSYRCSRKHLQNRRQCRCERHDGKCVCPRGRPSVDGHRHGRRRGDIVERFLVEIALAAHDEQLVRRHEAEALDRPQPNDARRSDLETELRTLDDARLTLARQERDGVLTSEEARPELADILRRATEVRAKLQDEIAAQRDPDAGVDAATLRERVQDVGPAFVRRLVSRVIDHYVLHPSQGPKAPFAGIDVVFAADYEVDPSAVETMRAELTEEWLRSERLSRVTWKRRATLEDEDLAFALWDGGHGLLEIVQRFDELGRLTPTGRTSWERSVIRDIVKRACERRGVEYVPRPAVRAKYPIETRNAIYELARERRPWPAIIADLEALGHRPVHGGQWRRSLLRALYASECARRGEKPQGRRHSLPPAMRQRIRVMARVEGKNTTEIANWLNERQIRRPTGTAWTRQSVSHVVRAAERELREQADC